MKIIMSLLALFLSISFGDILFADQNSNEIYLNYEGKRYTLIHFQRNDFFGVYAKEFDGLGNILDGLGGVKLYLFPNSKFIYSNWCDICGDKMIANGTYTFKDGKISLKFNYKDNKFKEEFINDSFHILEGRIELDNGVLVGFISILVDEEGLNTLRNQGDYWEYMIRGTVFYDWQDIYSHLMNKQN